jgi:hypothetical protein
VSITAAPFLSDTILAWSTVGKQCHVQRFAGKQESVQSFGCNEARIAMDPATISGQLVFVEDGTLYRSDIRIDKENMMSTKVRLAEGATSPRVAFDHVGNRFWISYLDVHGDVIVGFLDTDGRLASRALQGLRPDAEAYDLSVFSDGPWVVSVFSEAFGAIRMCAKPLDN